MIEVTPPFRPGDRVKITSIVRPNGVSFEKEVQSVTLFTEREVGTKINRYWRIELRAGRIFVIDEDGVTTNVFHKKRLIRANFCSR